MVIKKSLSARSPIIKTTNLSAQANPLQDFCLQQLPKVLELDDYRSFQSIIDTILSSHSNLFITNYSKNFLDLLILDLVFIKQAAGSKEWQIPDELNLFIDKICQKNKRLPILLYEDCILVNPPQPRTRLFSTGKVRKSEELFIYTHQQIEQKLASFIDYIESFHFLAVRASESVQTRNIAISYGQRSLELLKKIRFQLANLKKMPLEHFAGFRDYYKPLPGSDTFGPSGRFSAKFFTARILINGSAITKVLPNFFKDILGNLDYFPSRDRTKLLEVIANAQSNSQANSFTTNMEFILQDIAPDRSHRTFIKQAQAMGTLLDQLLGIHLGLVHRYVIPLESQSDSLPSQSS